MLGTWGMIVGILAIAVLFYRARARHWKATATILAEELVEIEDAAGGEVGEAAADALLRAGYEIGARDTAFEIMREQATGDDPERIRADRRH
jgi:hypothetical protein